MVFIILNFDQFKAIIIKTIKIRYIVNTLYLWLYKIEVKFFMFSMKFC